MANSYVFYPSETGARTDYAVPYEYLSQTFVKATVNGASVPFTFLSTYMIRFTTAPVGALKIYRETAKGPVNTYINGSILVDSQLNGSFLQSLHVSEEVADNAMVAGIDGAWDAQNLKVKNVADPSNPQDVVTKAWAEAIGNGYVGAAGASAAAAAADKATTIAARDLANKWASELEDVPVTTGKFSAFHWAQKALNAAAITLGNFAVMIHGATAKNTPVAADEFVMVDSEASWGLKKIDWTTLTTRIRDAMVDLTGTIWMTRQVFAANATGSTGTVATATNAGEIEVRGNGTGGAAIMTFHRPSQFAAYFGVDADNKWKVGGWSMGAVAYEIVHMGNYTTLMKLSKQYISAPQTITSAGLLTLAHGLGTKPLIVCASMQCVTAEYGYSIGDEVFVTPAMDDTGTAITRGISLVPDSTNIVIRQASNAGGPWAVINKSTGVAVGVTPANWRIIIKAWA